MMKLGYCAFTHARTSELVTEAGWMRPISLAIGIEEMIISSLSTNDIDNITCIIRCI